MLRFHESAVNAVAFLGDGRIVTGGEDGRIAIWRPGEPRPAIVFEGHTAPIVALAVSPDGATLASASWDRTVRLWPLAGGAPRVLEGHQQNVNGVAFTPDGKSLVSVSYDLTVRVWPLDDGSPTIVTLPTPLNARGGRARWRDHRRRGRRQGLFPLADRRIARRSGGWPTPVIAVAVSGDGALARRRRHPRLGRA